jgi:glycosyltransferase involved in cell wall biosynthesis
MHFSIVIPAHNGKWHLRFAIQSALNQVRKPDEIIVLDDASTDQTSVIAKSREWIGSIKYFHNETSTGFVDAWNRAIAKATGDFITILHQDDLLHPDYLGHIENALSRYPQVRHIYAACNYIDEEGNVIRLSPEPHSLEPVLYSGKQYAKNYLNGVMTNRHIHRCPGVTTSRALLLEECTYRREADHIADDDFFLRVGSFTDVAGISQPLASFRIHSASTTSKVDLLTLKLAQDYLFQLRYHRKNKTLLDSDDIVKVSQQAVKFINLLLFQSLLYEQNEWTAKAVSLRHEIDGILPSFMEGQLPVWARMLWAITSQSSSENHIAKLYVRCLHTLISARDLIRLRAKH